MWHKMAYNATLLNYKKSLKLNFYSYEPFANITQLMARFNCFPGTETLINDRSSEELYTFFLTKEKSDVIAKNKQNTFYIWRVCRPFRLLSFYGRFYLCFIGRNLNFNKYDQFATARAKVPLLNRDRVPGKDIEENEKVCDTLDVKGDLFCEKKN